MPPGQVVKLSPCVPQGQGFNSPQGRFSTSFGGAAVSPRIRDVAHSLCAPQLRHSCHQVAPDPQPTPTVSTEPRRSCLQMAPCSQLRHKLPYSSVTVWLVAWQWHTTATIGGTLAMALWLRLQRKGFSCCQLAASPAGFHLTAWWRRVSRGATPGPRPPAGATHCRDSC
ncbi:hypothetical protein F5Y10DRAFT_259355, partial [Nemania abortiva]